MRKIKHKTLESEKDTTQEVSTDENQETSRKSGGKEKKKKAKKKNKPKRKKQSDSNNDAEESLGNVPKKARKEMQINPPSRPDQASDAETEVDDSSLKENEKDTSDKDRIQETENDITQEEPEDSNPTSNRTDPPEPTNPNPGATPVQPLNLIPNLYLKIKLQEKIKNQPTIKMPKHQTTIPGSLQKIFKTMTSPLLKKIVINK